MTQRYDRWVRPNKNLDLKPSEKNADFNKCSPFSFYFFSHFDTSAEYRAYELTILDSVTHQSRVVVTTLDHIQYPMYYTVHKDESAQITGTWMCKGRTDGFEPICVRPAPLPTASQTPAQNSTQKPPGPALSTQSSTPAEVPPNVKVAKP